MTTAPLASKPGSFSLSLSAEPIDATWEPPMPRPSSPSSPLDHHQAVQVASKQAAVTLSPGLASAREGALSALLPPPSRPDDTAFLLRLQKVFEPEDGARVGTPELLDSPRLAEMVASAASRPLPVPSVFVDPRGEIHNLRVGTVDSESESKPPPSSSSSSSFGLSSALKRTRYNVLFTRTGMMRSGDVHREAQHDFVLDGCVNVWTLQGDGTTALNRYGPNSYISVPPYTPHVFEFVEDTAMVEWWDTDDFAAWYYRPYRDVVDANNRERQRRGKSASRLVRYAPAAAAVAEGHGSRALKPALAGPVSAILSWKFLLGLGAGAAAAAAGGRLAAAASFAGGTGRNDGG